MRTNVLKVKAYDQRKGEERDRQILQHLPQIRYIAQRIAVRLPSEVQLEDLMSAGVLGLMDAVEKFDANKGVQFKTYAEVRIRGAILDSLRGLDWAPRSLRKKSKEVERTYAALEQRFGRPASDEEMAKALGMELRAFHSLLDQLNGLNIGHFQLVASEGEVVDQDDLPLKYVPTSHEESPFETVQKNEMRRLLAKAIQRLPEREQLVVSLYYYEELTMKEIGQILGVNESRVSQLHTRCMLRLRGKIQAMLRK
ncbi:MAG: FliA/WhiG family RNA polymerase sigma factor [Acidobacteriota bacterium]